MNQISLAEYRQQIEDAIQDGRYEEAVAHGRHILEWYPKYIGAYWLLGKAMLEAGQNDQATDMFQRVLSADPEHMLAWVGMSETAKRYDKLQDAVWYLERAFELATDNEMVAEELRRLYGELEGSEPQRLQLTESALAKLYLRGDLLTRAITELRKLIKENPDRLDLKVALAEALWRDGQRLQASRVCQDVLEEQPFILKANLILGEIWSSSDRSAEGDIYLDRAEALDPENEMAQELFGSASPLAPAAPDIEPMTYEVGPGDERPDWLVEMERAVVDQAEEAVEAEIEIPVWLEELGDAPTPEAPAELEEEPPVEAAAEEKPEIVAEEEELPEERTVEHLAPEPAAPEAVEEDILDWLDELEEEEIAASPAEVVEEELPAWLEEIKGAPEAEGIGLEAEEALEDLEPAEIPDWLKDLAPPAAEPPMRAPRKPLEAIFDEEAPRKEPMAEEWDIEELEAEELEMPEPEAEGPEIEAPERMAELPAWLESDEMPSGDDALAWLAQLAEGKEEELLAQAEKESEARLAEILGRAGAPAEDEPEAPELEAEPRLPEEEAVGWTAFDEIEEVALQEEEEEVAEELAPEEAIPEEEAPPVEEPLPVALEEEEEEVAEELAPEEAIPEEEAPPVEEPLPVALEEEEEEVAEELAPEEALVPERMPVAEAVEKAAVEDLDRFIAAQRAYAEEHPSDREAQLELGRVLWQVDQRLDAVEVYERLIGRSELLGDVIADLEDYREQWSDPQVMQSLGDAYMKADRLQDALDTYRQALASL